jgi:hypothetical protein
MFVAEAFKHYLIYPSSTLQASKEGPSSPANTSAPAPEQKPVHDVMAGAMARAASQGTIHPLDTLKVQMQVGRRGGHAGKDRHLLVRICWDSILLQTL